MKLSGPKRTKERARDLRATMSLPERLLWSQLRKKRLGLRFRRQHPAGPYVLDFYCDQAKLCVEVDGGGHDFTAGRDALRDRWLAAQGVRTLRIAARDVLDNLDGVIQHIAAEAAAPPSRRRVIPPPLRGRSVRRSRRAPVIHSFSTEYPRNIHQIIPLCLPSQSLRDSLAAWGVHRAAWV